MKKMTKLFSMLTLVLCVVSCQLSGVDEGVLAGGSLSVTAVIDAGTRVTYAVDNEIAYTITPTWTVGDKIIGFDDKGVKFTFTVEEQTDGVAALNVGTYTPGSATKLYAIYAPGMTEDNIVGGELAVDLSAQNGALNDASKVLMNATAAIESGTVRFHFEKATAVVGLRKFKLPVTFATAITKMKLNGVVTSGTFRVVDGALTLVPGTTRGTVTATRTWTTDNAGLCTVPAYFSVIPTADAEMSVDADTPSKTYTNLHPIDKMNVEAGIYYHMTKLFYSPEASVNGVPYSTVVEAFDAANEVNEPAVIKLLSNCKAEEPIVLYNINSEGYTLDLNGKTLTTTAANTITLSLCQLTITDLSTDNPAAYGTITTEGSNSDQYIIIVQDEALLKMEKGNIIAPAYRCLSFKAGGSGELYGDGLVSSPSGYAIYQTSTGGSLNIREDVRIQGRGNVVYYGTGYSEVMGGIISNTASGAIVYVSGDATVKAGGNCRVNSTYTANRNAFYQNGSSAHVYVVGGYYGMPVYANACKDENDAPCVNVLNTDPATAADYPYTVVPAPNNEIVITTVNAEYLWNHGTLESGIMHADKRSSQNSEMSLVLVKDLNLNETLSLPSDHRYGLTLDLNGCKINSTASPAVTTAGNLTLEDAVGTGEIESSGNVALEATAGETIINGGSLVATASAFSISGSAKSTINKGWFAAESVDMAKSGSAKIEAYGGFYKNDPTPFLAENCEKMDVSETHNGRTYNYQVKGGSAVATVNGEDCPSFDNALSQAIAYSGADDTVTLRLMKDISDYGKQLDLTNKNGKPFILDLNGHTLGVVIDSCMTTTGTLVITDRSGSNTGKYTSSKRKQLYFSTGAVTIKDCIIECTRGGYMSTGATYTMINAAGTSSAKNTGGLTIINSKVYSNSYLKPIYIAYGNLTIENSELQCGTESTGGYYIVDVYTGGNVIINNSSFVTFDRKSNGDKYGCVHTRTGNITSGSYIELNDCWFYSGKGLSTAADHEEYSKVMKIKNCYSNVDFTPYVPQAVYEAGTSLKPIDPPAKHTHMGVEYSYGYQVK